MKTLEILGAALFVIGILTSMGYGLYVMFAASELPLFIKIGVILAIIGAAIILISVVRDRMKEKD